MAGLTLEKAQEMLDLYIEADAAVATGQSYSIGGRSLSRVNAADITDKITFYQRQVNNLTRGGIAIKRVIPRDR